MDKLGIWLGQAWQHLQDHWRDHLVPALALGGIIFAMVFVGILVVGGLTMIGVALDEEELTIALAMGGSLLFTLVFMVAYLPLVVGYIKGTLKLMRGGEFVVGDLFSGLRETPAALLVMAITMIGVWIGMLFFYIPGIIVAVVLWFTLPLVADGVGPIDAVKKSIEMIKPYFFPMLVYQFIFGFLIGVVAYIPFVGMFLVMPISFVMMAVPYLDLYREHFGEHPDEIEDEDFGEGPVRDAYGEL